MNIPDFSAISFFTVSKYEYKTETVCDFRSCPRPHFCMGLILEGDGFFSSETDCDEEIHVVPGDIIFVPITSRYISVWRGTPRVAYTSMHFSFENSAFFFNNQTIKIQKVTLPDFEKLKKDFANVYSNYNGELAQQFGALSIFYKVLCQIEPILKRSKTMCPDKRIEHAIEYINMNSEKEISIPYLAEMCNMSVSHFYTCFKSAVGMTAIEYKNMICINRAMLLLIRDYDKSIEEISETLGFYSSTYFRRIFKRITGKTPTEYRKSAIEM